MCGLSAEYLFHIFKSLCLQSSQIHKVSSYYIYYKQIYMRCNEQSKQPPRMFECTSQI